MRFSPLARAARRAVTFVGDKSEQATDAVARAVGYFVRRWGVLGVALAVACMVALGAGAIALQRGILQSAGFLQSGANALLRSAEGRFRDTVSMADFVGSDPGVQLNNAIAALPANGGTVLVPAGAYTFATSVTIAKPVAIMFGSGEITYSGTGQFISCSSGTRGVLISGTGQRADQGNAPRGTAITVTNTAANGIDALDCPGIRIQNLTMLGPASGTGIGVHVTGHGLILDNVQAAVFGGDGIQIDGTRGNSNSCALIRVTSILNGGKGFNTFGANSNACSWESTDAISNVGTQYIFNGTMNHTFSGVHALPPSDVASFSFLGSSSNQGSIYSEPVTPFASAAVTFDGTSSFNDLFLLNGRAVTDSGISNNWYFAAGDFTPPAGVRKIIQANTDVDTAFNPILRMQRRQQIQEATDQGVYIKSGSFLAGYMMTGNGSLNFRYNTAASSFTTNFWNGTSDASIPAATPVLKFDQNSKVAVGFGLLPDAAGLKHKRVSTGSITAGTISPVTVTWGTTFPDTNYTVSVSVVDATTGAGLEIEHVSVVNAASIVVYVNNGSAGALTGTLNAIAIHD